MSNGSAVDKRLNTMTEKASLLNEAELDALIEMLSSPGDENDDAIAWSESDGRLAEELAGRLERGSAELRARGEDLPTNLSKTLASLDAHMRENKPMSAQAWIDALLAGERPTGRAGAPAFRTLRRDLLTEEDVKILKEIAQEIRSQKKQ